jgi:hypothetical protein
LLSVHKLLFEFCKYRIDVCKENIMLLLIFASS